jgi:hypothetical protein
MQGGLFAPVSREGALVLNNLFLAAACAAVFIGTLYPLALEAVTSISWLFPGGPHKISVGPPFFNATFIPLIVPLLLLMPWGQSLAWKRGDLLGVAQRLAATCAIAILTTMAVYAASLWRAGGGAAGDRPRGLCAILGSLSEIVTRSWRRGGGAMLALRRAAGLPRSAWGAALAHAGIGVTVIGIAATAWGVERIGSLKPGESLQVGAYTVVLEKTFARQRPDYSETVARLDIRRDGVSLGHIEPGKRIFPGRTMETSEAGLLDGGSWPGLCQRRRGRGRRRRGPARLLEAAGAADLAGLAGDGDRRGALPCSTGAPVSARRLGQGLPPAAAEQDRRRHRGYSSLWTLAAFVALPLWAALAPSPALAVRADVAPGPTPRWRAGPGDISAGLRCLVCQNQSIDDSDAPLARDLRVLVRERLKAGDDDSAVTRYVVERYGEFVLL